MAAWREGISGGFLDRAADMMLRFDNAAALPTCPQPQQQQKAALFAARFSRSERPRVQLTNRSPWFHRCAPLHTAVEPVICHLKSEHLIDRNYR